MYEERVLEKTSGSLPREFVSLFLHNEYNSFLYDNVAKLDGA